MSHPLFDDKYRENMEASSFSYNHKDAMDYVPDGFSVHSVLKEKDTDFKSVTYVDESSNKAIIAFPGTHSIRDAFADVSDIGWAQWESARSHIISQVKELRDSGIQDISFTGHSLGGTIAQYASYESAVFCDKEYGNTDGLSLYTFNAPGGALGLHRNIDNPNYDILHEYDINHFVIKDDLVPTLGSGHLGGVVNTIHPQEEVGAYVHMMSNFHDFSNGEVDFRIDREEPEYLKNMQVLGAVTGVFARSGMHTGFDKRNEFLANVEAGLRTAGTLFASVALTTGRKFPLTLGTGHLPQGLGESLEGSVNDLWQKGINSLAASNTWNVKPGIWHELGEVDIESKLKNPFVAHAVAGLAAVCFTAANLMNDVAHAVKNMKEFAGDVKDYITDKVNGVVTALTGGVEDFKEFINNDDIGKKEYRKFDHAMEVLKVKMDENGSQILTVAKEGTVPLDYDGISEKYAAVEVGENFAPKINPDISNWAKKKREAELNINDPSVNLDEPASKPSFGIA